ncbi:MAG: hypothetical protein Q4G09_03245 [Clostridia bacterium]|nr:hypothetical protein [Clostridia bacterium]
MEKSKIEEILKENRLYKLKKESYIKKLLFNLAQYNKKDLIYPKDLYWSYKEDKDYVYAVLDLLKKEEVLKSFIVMKCCRCERIKTLKRYLMKNEEIICEECGADNDDRDCSILYEVI